MSEQLLLISLVLLNLAAGLAVAVPAAKLLRSARPVRFGWCYTACLGIYLMECVAFPMGMATQVFAFALAVVWGIALGLWLPGSTPFAQVRRIASIVGVYSSLPTATFCLLLAITWFSNGGPMLSADAGHQFGIPEFVPWPLSTILGFCMALGLGTVVIKCMLTVGIALYSVRRTRARAASPSRIAPHARGCS